MNIGDIVFEIGRYSDEPILAPGPVLITKMHSENHVDICYLNNPHIQEPQGLGFVPGFRFKQMKEVPEIWKEMLSMWVTRAITSFDSNLTMNYEAGEGALKELRRLGL